ncbi:MAG: toll/interleukin-1 receptor domain-containing protein [Proteobacteria bacterium]|nr:toll/interleukin-1 receptor domain-containing protein [Pseudomonadota bacterium]
MADIFISYAREDRDWVSRLAETFVAEGYSVWWDFDLLVGKRYRETIEAELQQCKATVVVWSQHSIRSDFVRDEAEEGQQRNVLLPVLKEAIRPPAGFRQLQTADLSAWTGELSHAEFRRMMKGVSYLVGREPKSEETGVAPEVAPSDPVPPAPTQPATFVAPPAQPAAAAPAHAPVLAPATPAARGLSPVVQWVALGVGVVIVIGAIYGIAGLFGSGSPKAPPAAKPVPAAAVPTAPSTTPPPVPPAPAATGGDEGQQGSRGGGGSARPSDTLSTGGDNNNSGGSDLEGSQQRGQ